VLAGVMLLRYIEQGAAADRLKAAVFAVLAKGRTLTRDMGGAATTTDVRDALLREIERMPVPAAG
jgi:isocitrate/isopropylmalate dehydrogenase